MQLLSSSKERIREGDGRQQNHRTDAIVEQEYPMLAQSPSTFSAPSAAHDTANERRGRLRLLADARASIRWAHVSPGGCRFHHRGSDAVALVWPPGHSARGNPLTIFNEKGNAVATVGKLANLDGSVAAPESMQGRPIFGCPLVSSVELVAPIE